MQETTATKKASIPTLALLSLPEAGAVLINNIVNLVLLKYYTDVIGLDASAFGLIYGLFTVWNAINNPLLGLTFDHLALKYKRPITTRVMRVAAPIMLLGCVSMLFADPSWTQLAIMVFLGIFLFVYDVAYAALSLSSTVFFVNAFPDADERSRYLVVKSYVVMIPSFLSTAIPTLVLTGDFDPTVGKVLLVTVMVLAITLILVGTIFIRRQNEHVAARVPAVLEQRPPFLTMFKATFRNKAFVLHLAYAILTRACIGIYMTGYMYYMDYVIHVSGFQAMLPDITGGIYQLVLYPFMLAVIRKKGLRFVMASFLSTSVVCFTGLFFATEYWQAYVLYVLLMTGLATAFAMTGSLLSSIIDKHEMDTGFRQPGLFVSIGNFFADPGKALHIAIFTALLTSFHFASAVNGVKQVQSASAELGIRIGVGLVPAFFTAVGVVILLAIPITKKTEQDLKNFREGKA